ncbi:hypothetical protein ZHAS_00012619 [Anopheles sinensis]|uniref:Uncharacterized protein n=1 Tax=Anopheles sinensis TaxID=74873 RepID=A0A084W3C3_ANOSI|nr:hypothetical protein ZHAS_00012619 [Anopheles sinensis]
MFYVTRCLPFPAPDDYIVLDVAACEARLPEKGSIFPRGAVPTRAAPMSRILRSALDRQMEKKLRALCEFSSLNVIRPKSRPPHSACSLRLRLSFFLSIYVINREPFLLQHPTGNATGSFPSLGPHETGPSKKTHLRVFVQMMKFLRTPTVARRGVDVWGPKKTRGEESGKQKSRTLPANEEKPKSH